MRLSNAASCLFVYFVYLLSGVVLICPDCIIAFILGSVSKEIGSPEVMTEQTTTIGGAVLASFVVKKTNVLLLSGYFKPTACCCCCEFAATPSLENSRLTTIKETT
jgi:hypothetical protein